MSDFSEDGTLELVLFSDSHGNVANMTDVVRLKHPDRALHMGDLARNAEGLVRQLPDIPVTYVPGNCDDHRPDLPDKRCFTPEEHKILVTHDHTYHVKMRPGVVIRTAREAGVRFLCPGHIHEVLCEFQNSLWIVNHGATGNLVQPTYVVAVLERDDAACYLSRI